MTALSVQQPDEQLPEPRDGCTPVALALPQILDHRTVPTDLRVASTTALSICTALKMGCLIAKDGQELPLAGIIITQESTADRAAMEQHFPNVGFVQLFNPTSRTSRANQLKRFALDYADVLAAGKTPVVLLPGMYHAAPGQLGQNPVNAYFVGMVAAALAPKGVLLCAEGNLTRPDCYGTYDANVDALALAASQGYAATVQRRIMDGSPDWPHVSLQLSRFEKQFQSFHTKRVTNCKYLPADYMWTERDWRNKGDNQVFGRHHMVMLGAVPDRGEPELRWVDHLRQMFRPSNDYDKDPMRIINAFRNWLVSDGPSLLGQPIQPDMHKLERPADADVPQAGTATLKISNG